MIILGIDPGTATTGYGLIKKDRQNYKVLNYGCILTPTGTKLPERLEILAVELVKIIKKHNPNHLAVEKLFFAANAKTATDVGHARGVVLLISWQSKVPIFEYTPLEVKMALTGYGRAEKRQVQQMVKAICNLSKIPKPDDAADALAVAVCHGNTFKNFKF